jgi:uncharacterized protein (TIGR04141 family)
MPERTIGLTIFLIKPNTSPSECLRTAKATFTSEFEFHDGSVASLHTFTTPPQAPKWYKFLSDAIQNLPSILSSSASAVLLVSKHDRLFALTFGYGRSLLNPGSWEEDFGLKVTLNSVDRTRIKTVDRTTLDAIGQHSRIQASRDASIGEFGLDLEQDFLRAVTGKATDPTLGKVLTGKDALSVTITISPQGIPALLGRYLAQSESEAYKAAFPWVDQIHEVKSPTKLADLDSTLVERLKSDDPGRLWLSIPEIIEWSRVEGFKYRNSGKAKQFPDVHVSDWLSQIGGGQNVSAETLRKRYRVLAMAQDSEEVYRQWTIYRCLYCEVDEGHDTYLLSNGKWYRLGTDFRERINAQFAAVPHSTIHLPEYDDKSEGEYNTRVVAELGDGFALMDEQLIRCGRQYDKVEFCDLFAKTKHIVHVKRYAGASAPLSHMFAQAVVSGSLFRRDTQFRADVNALLPQPFRPVTDEPKPEEYEVVFGVVSKSQHDLVLPFFSRVNLNNARNRLLDLGYRVSLKKIQAQA